MAALLRIVRRFDELDAIHPMSEPQSSSAYELPKPRGVGSLGVAAPAGAGCRHYQVRVAAVGSFRCTSCEADLSDWG